MFAIFAGLVQQVIKLRCSTSQITSEAGKTRWIVKVFTKVIAVYPLGNINAYQYLIAVHHWQFSCIKRAWTNTLGYRNNLRKNDADMGLLRGKTANK